MAPREKPENKVKTQKKKDAPPTPDTPSPNALTANNCTEGTTYKALINQIKEFFAQIANAGSKASRVRNGYDSNGSVPRPAQAARSISYSEFSIHTFGLQRH
ncbi:hypothetical protein Tco_0519272 [Tanacetum coccineum]